MSAVELKTQIQNIRKLINSPFSTTTYSRKITNQFLSQVNLLQSLYGNFLGKCKAKHSGYVQELKQIDESVETYFGYLLKNPDANVSFQLINMAIGKISEMISFVEGLDESDEKLVPKLKLDEVIGEKEALKQTLEFMVKFKGLPELNELLESAKNVQLEVDEHWVLALCSVNLIEASVNKKLEELNVPVDGNFDKKYNRLINFVKEKEDRNIQQLLPKALYKGIRNKLDHASNSNKVTPKEAKQISQLVKNLIEELFQ